MDKVFVLVLDIALMFLVAWLYTIGYIFTAYLIGFVALLLGLGAATDWIFFNSIFELFSDIDIDL